MGAHAEITSVQDKSVREKLVGAWQLVSWEERDATGKVTYPLGQDAIGQILYEVTGRMSAQLMRRNQKRFAKEDWQRATVEEKDAAWSSYFGYFGTFTIDEDAHAITHDVEGSWFPNLVGTKQIRHYRFEGHQLVLDADTEWGQVHIVWEKVEAKK